MLVVMYGCCCALVGKSGVFVFDFIYESCLSIGVIRGHIEVMYIEVMLVARRLLRFYRDHEI